MHTTQENSNVSIVFVKFVKSKIVSLWTPIHIQTEQKLLNFADQMSGGVTDVLQTVMKLAKTSHMYFYRINSDKINKYQNAI